MVWKGWTLLDRGPSERHLKLTSIPTLVFVTTRTAISEPQHVLSQESANAWSQRPMHLALDKQSSWKKHGRQDRVAVGDLGETKDSDPAKYQHSLLASPRVREMIPG